MVRTQIHLTEQQARQVKTIAKQEGVSASALIRQCVEEGLSKRGSSRAVLYQRASGLVGRMEDPAGADDLSMDHDRYLDETFG